MTIAVSLYEYFRDCPLLARGTRLRFNYLSTTPQEFAIEDTPEDPVIKRYTGGDSVRQKTFNLTSVEQYSEDQRVNIEKSGFFERLQDWIEEQNKKRNFPDMGEGREPRSLTCLTAGYLYTSEENIAHYQIQLRLIYYKAA